MLSYTYTWLTEVADVHKVFSVQVRFLFFNVESYGIRGKLPKYYCMLVKKITNFSHAH